MCLPLHIIVLEITVRLYCTFAQHIMLFSNVTVRHSPTSQEAQRKDHLVTCEGAGTFIAKGISIRTAEYESSA